jgi:hypothetical protein
LRRYFHDAQKKALLTAGMAKKLGLHSSGLNVKESKEKPKQILRTRKYHTKIGMKRERKWKGHTHQ